MKLPIYGREVKIITDDTVDLEYGTGVVMICTFGDNTEGEWVTRYNLDIINAIDEKGEMLPEAGKYAGMTIKEGRSSNIEDLKEEGYLIKQEDVDNVMTRILLMHDEFVSRISHTQQGNVKGFYKKLPMDITAPDSHIVSTISQNF